MGRYTTVEAIQRRLPGRLNLSGASAAFGSPGVEPDFVETVITQVEAMVDSHLRQRYKYPLALSSSETVAILAHITELLVAAEIADTYYWTEEQAGGLVKRYRSQAMTQLEALASGDRGLTGEQVVITGSSQVPAYTFVGKREGTSYDNAYDLDKRRYKGGYRR